MPRHPGSVKWYARRYINFYSRILSIRENIIFADFHHVTQELGGVIGKVNDKFSAEFKTFVHFKKNVDFVFQQIHESHPLILEAIRLYEAIICECYP